MELQHMILIVLGIEKKAFFWRVKEIIFIEHILCFLDIVYLLIFIAVL